GADSDPRRDSAAIRRESGCVQSQKPVPVGPWRERRRMDGPIWYLKRCDLFGRLSEAEADRLNRRARIRRYPRGELIYAPADAGLAVLVLARSRVNIHDLTPDGRETIIAVIQEREIFGEGAVLCSRAPREATTAGVPAPVSAGPAL